MVAKYPDITDWKNLNKYASMFKTSESGGKGQLLDGDPSYVTNDAALVKNLKLNYKVVQGGSEAALITSFRSAQQNKKPLLAYFYQPQWFFNEVPLVKVNLPTWKTGCDAVAAKVNCDYPPYNLNKVVATKFANSGSPGFTVVKNFTLTNEQQNTVSKYLAVDKLTDNAAAAKFFAANPAVETQWLQGTGVS
jgi:glycine betaine/proline transport system substrate-binding protein